MKGAVWESRRGITNGWSGEGLAVPGEEDRVGRAAGAEYITELAETHEGAIECDGIHASFASESLSDREYGLQKCALAGTVGAGEDG